MVVEFAFALGLGFAVGLGACEHKKIYMSPTLFFLMDARRGGGGF